MRRIVIALLGTLMLTFCLSVGTAVAAQAQVQTQVCPAYPAPDYSFPDGTCPRSQYKNLNDVKPTVQGLLNDDYMNQNSINDLYNQVDRAWQAGAWAIEFGCVVAAIAFVFAFIMFLMWWRLRSEMKAIVAAKPGE